MDRGRTIGLGMHGVPLVQSGTQLTSFSPRQLSSGYDDLYVPIRSPAMESQGPQVIVKRRNYTLMSFLAAAGLLKLGLILSVMFLRKGVAKPNVLVFKMPDDVRLVPFKNHTTVADTPGLCDPISRKIYARNGSVADCAVAFVLCMAVVAPHRIGLAGGFFATVYIRQSKNISVLDAREAAPSDINKSEINTNSSRLPLIGGRSVGVPALVPGLEALHSRFGKLPWASLFEDAVRLARFGFPVYAELAAVLDKYAKAVSQRHTLRRLFWNRVSRQVYRENEILRQPTLALTLIRIAHQGYGGFLQGDMGAKFLLDLRQLGALVSRSDLAQYRALWKVPVRSVPLGGVTVHAPPPPGAGSLLAFMLSTMDMFRSSKGDLMDEGALTYHRLVETFKFALPFREDLGDDQFEDVGDTIRNMASRGQALKVNGRIADSSTYSDAIFYVFDMQLVRRSFSSLSERAHIARYTRGAAAHSRSHVRYGTPTKSAVTAKRVVKKSLDVRHGSGNAVFVAPNGDAIAFSASIGMLLGSREASSSTGLVLNNALHSFTARDPNRYLGHAGVSLNHPRPGKRPLSPLAPCVVLDGDRNLMAAAAASELFQVPQYSATILLELLFMNKTMADAISAPKLRYRADVKGVLHDVDLPRSMVLELQKKGHHMFLMDDKITNAVGVSVDDDNNLYPGVNERVGGHFNGQ